MSTNPAKDAEDFHRKYIDIAAVPAQEALWAIAEQIALLRAELAAK